MGGDPLTRRTAEALAGGERAGRLGRALARLVRELADAQRLIAVLRRENMPVRAQLARLPGGREAPPAAHSEGSGGEAVWGEA